MRFQLWCFSLGGQLQRVICRSLADFARFLFAQQGDERWEELLDGKDKRPKLDAFLRESAAEGGEADIQHVIACVTGSKRL
ncbi:MAG: hypothetical protein ABIP20_20490 [Chthoniobacteraceae bacterium]